ncbi:MAG: hypothetical protein DRH08_12640, partial [Deltaproteobacteria bacterium]
MRLTKLALLVLAVASLTSGAMAGRQTYEHQEYFEHYEGTATCLECHEEEAESFFHSQHYQWQGDAPDIEGADGRKLGKLNTMNDFCTYPVANWIGRTTNAGGTILSRGCSACHAGLGKMPEPELSREQLENIDCLICHAKGYRREVYELEDGGWEWRPILWKNQRGLDSVAGRIVRPERTMCLRCHSGAGGGPNFKRGDIEYVMKECEPEFDVHMAASGNDLHCVDCHEGEDHRVRGRGADLSGTDLPDNRLDCTGCHDAEPHDIAALDHHTKRVHCTACHIPTFAKADSTDMRRDWSTPKYYEEEDKYTATITFGKDVVPVYAWFDGRTRSQFMGEKVWRRKDGVIPIMTPVADRGDKKAKIYPFKLHQGVLPLLKDKEWLIPLEVEEFFADGELEHAVAAGAKAAYGIEHPEFTWVEVI